MVGQETMDVDYEISPESFTCRGPDSPYVKLISSDGYEFFIRRRYTKASGTIDHMLATPDGGYTADEINAITLKDIESSALSRASEYLCYYEKYTDCWYQIPEFPIDEKLCVDLLLCANFMKC